MSDVYYRADLQLPLGVTADGELTRAGSIVGAVAGTIAVFTCWPLAVLGILLNCIGLDLVTKAPRDARPFFIASWITLAAAPASTLFWTLILI